MRFPIAVDSPPGTIIPARPSRSPTSRTSTGSTPSLLRTSACSLKSPCKARTPILCGAVDSCLLPLPSTSSEPLSFREVADLPAHHRLAEALARLRDDLRVAEVGRGLHDRARTARGVPTLEDAAPDEDPVRPELHHQRRVGRRGDPPAVKRTTGNFPFSATHLTRSYGAPRFFASVISSSEPRVVRRLIPPTIARMWR